MLDYLNNISIILVGQLKTARTETIEEFLINKTRDLTVVGLMSPYSTYNEARCTTYVNGKKKQQFHLPQFSIGRMKYLIQPLIVISFIFYFFSFSLSIIRLHKRFNLYIGCATFPTLFGIFLKKMQIVDSVIYYCLDYYPTPKNFNFTYFLNIIYRWMDNYCINNSDVIWEISPKIRDAREKYSKKLFKRYSPLIVPMGWNSAISSNIPIAKRDRWSIGFIGTLSDNQGLQMVLKAFPKLLLKFPQLKLHIIGSGPYREQIELLIKNLDLKSSVILHGFIKDENKAFDILKHCMIGIAPWTGDSADNSHYADPGKPKLYALLGLPILLTKYTMIASEIARMGAGIAINYNEIEFIDALDEMISDLSSHQKFLNAVEHFKKLCDADSIFSNAFIETISYRGVH